METLIIGLIFLIPGIFLVFWINKRKFNRRNVAGLEGFSSYEKSPFVRFLERIGKWAAYACIIFGLLLLWTYSREKKQQEARIENTINKNKSAR